jgi:hypothetical protein
MLTVDEKTASTSRGQILFAEIAHCPGYVGNLRRSSNVIGILLLFAKRQRDAMVMHITPGGYFNSRNRLF